MSENKKPAKTAKTAKTTKKAPVKKKVQPSSGYCKIYHNIKLTRQAAEIAKSRMQDEKLTISQLVITLLMESNDDN